MRSLVDCPSCACLIEGRETACPFCGAIVRSGGGMPAWLALGLVLGVGVADVSCGGKGDGGDEETSVASGVTYAGPDSSYTDSGGTDTGDTTSQAPGTASGVTYAGPDETWTASEATTTGSTGGSGGSSGGTEGSTGDTDSSSTAASTSSSGDASTYAGPDETGSTGP